jgi:hypothetical protein
MLGIIIAKDNVIYKNISPFSYNVKGMSMKGIIWL